MLAVVPDPSGLAENQQHLATLPARADGPGGPLALYLHVEDATEVYGQAQAPKAEIIEDIWDAWWGGRQFSVTDPDGTWWTVFQPTGG